MQHSKILQILKENYLIQSKTWDSLLSVLINNSKFCERYHPNWDTLNLEDKRKVMLTCYNAGPGKVRDKAKWDLESKKLNKEQREYANIIMEAYHNPEIKVKLD